MIETDLNTSTLAARLRERIKREGPITFCDWMKAALYDPQDGYYCRSHQRPWGREGDYRTSPERTPLFAATFARYFASLHERLGHPAAWTIFEAGAGDGRFAEGVLGTLQKSFPKAFAATTYRIDEVSLFSGAREQLKKFADRVHFGSLYRVQMDPGLVFSNELLDAFPVHRVVSHGDEFEEFYVALDEFGGFKWSTGPLSPQLTSRLKSYLKDVGRQPVAGQIIEVNLEIEDWLRRVSASLHRGFVVTVDYGITAEDLYSPAAAKKGTLRSFKRHQFVDDLLASPGEHDLTSTINWDVVRSAGKRASLQFVELSRLDQFLLANGFLEQLETASKQATDESQHLRFSTAAREMILPGGMAASFQVLVQNKAVN